MAMTVLDNESEGNLISHFLHFAWLLFTFLLAFGIAHWCKHKCLGGNPEVNKPSKPEERKLPPSLMEIARAENLPRTNKAFRIRFGI